MRRLIFAFSLVIISSLIFTALYFVAIYFFPEQVIRHSPWAGPALHAAADGLGDIEKMNEIMERFELEGTDGLISYLKHDNEDIREVACWNILPMRSYNHEYAEALRAAWLENRNVQLFQYLIYIWPKTAEFLLVEWEKMPATEKERIINADYLEVPSAEGDTFAMGFRYERIDPAMLELLIRMHEFNRLNEYSSEVLYGFLISYDFDDIPLTPDQRNRLVDVLVNRPSCLDSYDIVGLFSPEVIIDLLTSDRHAEECLEELSYSSEDLSDAQWEDLIKQFVILFDRGDSKHFSPISVVHFLGEHRLDLVRRINKQKFDKTKTMQLGNLVRSMVAWGSSVPADGHELKPLYDFLYYVGTDIDGTVKLDQLMKLVNRTKGLSRQHAYEMVLHFHPHIIKGLVAGDNQDPRVFGALCSKYRSERIKQIRGEVREFNPSPFVESTWRLLMEGKCEKSVVREMIEWLSLVAVNGEANLNRLRLDYILQLFLSEQTDYREALYIEKIFGANGYRDEMIQRLRAELSKDHPTKTISNILDALRYLMVEKTE